MIDQNNMRCTWVQDGDPDSDTWATDCGNMFILNEGSPKENDLKFCCYCGKPIDEEKLTWEDYDAKK